MAEIATLTPVVPFDESPVDSPRLDETVPAQRPVPEALSVVPDANNGVAQTTPSNLVKMELAASASLENFRNKASSSLDNFRNRASSSLDNFRNKASSNLEKQVRKGPRASAFMGSVAPTEVGAPTALMCPITTWNQASPRSPKSPKSEPPDPRTEHIQAWRHGHDNGRNTDEAKPFKWCLWFESVALLAIAGFDNVMAYLTFLTVRAFHSRLYNIVDLHMTLLPGIDIALLCFAVIGTMVFVAMIVLVECWNFPLWHELMNFRIFFSSLPCGIICSILVYYSERTEWAPFATVIAVTANVFVWCLHMRIQYSHQLNVVSKIFLDISWFLAVLLAIGLGALFASDQLSVLTGSDTIGCPYASNVAMPVYVLPLQRWYCSQWDDVAPTPISRTPINTEPRHLSCSDTFIAAFGASIEAHFIQCPVGCLRNFVPRQGTNVVGCGIYAVDSPVCVAAVHAGRLTDTGGQAVIYGRLGVSHFLRCSRNSVTSIDRYITQTNAGVSVTQPVAGRGSASFFMDGGRRLSVTVPIVLDSRGMTVPQAFHFNNDQPGGLPQTSEFIWLKKYDQVGKGSEVGKPWTQIEGTVSLRFAGIELEDEKVILGAGQAQALFVKPRVGQVFKEKPIECRIGESAVMCKGAGAAVVQLDFCRKDVKQCPDK